MTAGAAWTDRIIEGGALFLLAFTPLAFGTVQPWSEAVAELVILGMAVAWVAGMLRQWELRVELPPGWLPATLFLALVFAQLVPLPAPVVELVSPLSAELRRAAAAFTGTAPGLAPLSLAPHATWREGVKLASVALFFLVLYNSYRTRAQVDRALWTMIVTGTIVSVFGIVQRMTWTGRFYWVGPEAPHSEAFGPFVNRAHFAGLMVVVVPMALALALSRRRQPGRSRSGPGHRWADRLHRWSASGSGATRLLPFFVLVMGGAALVSRSRGGLVALLAALLCMVGLSAQGRSGARRAAQAAIATALIVLAGVWIGGDILYGTVGRLAEEVGRPAESARVRIWADALGLWWASPVVGTGLGSFAAAFPLVRTVQAPVAYTHAESDWVQLLTDTGLPGLALALAAAAAVGAALLARVREATSPRSRALALAGFVALAGAAVQGIGNFNLPVTSNFVYLAAALAAAFRGES